jgi:hypothetical protein
MAPILGNAGLYCWNNLLHPQVTGFNYTYLMRSNVYQTHSMWIYCHDIFSPSIITSFSNPISLTDISKSRLFHTQTSSLLTQACLKVVSLALYFTSFTLLAYQPPQTQPQPPLQTIQLSWPLTLIRPLPPRNYKPASLLFSIGLPNGD